MTIKAKKYNKIDKRNIIKVLKMKNTIVICDEYLTDDYQNDAANNFNYGKIKENSEMIEEIKEYSDYFTITANKNNTINIFNDYSSYIIKNKDLIIEF